MQGRKSECGLAPDDPQCLDFDKEEEFKRTKARQWHALELAKTL